MRTKVINVFAYSIGAIFIPMLLNACSENDSFLDDIETSPQIQGVVASVTDFELESGSTRVNLTPTQSGLSFSWKNGDVISILTQESMSNAPVREIIETKKQSAKFDGSGFNLDEGATYHAFYPYIKNFTNATSDIKVDYTGQIQVGNGSTEHLGQYDYMKASAVATAPNEAMFLFQHLGAIVKVEIVAPEPGIYTKLTLSSDQIPFITEGIFNFSDNTGLSPQKTDNSISLELNQVVLSSDLELTAYFFLAPINLDNEDITICLTNQNGNEFFAKVTGKDFIAGSAYGLYAPHTYVDLDLPNGTLWATCNVGALSSSKGGDLYAWGEITTKEICYQDWSNYKWCDKKQEVLHQCRNITKYGVDSQWGVVDGLTELLPEDDVVYCNWGKTWRMPTASEQEELFTNCFWSKSTNYNGTGDKGYILYKAKKAEHKGKFSELMPEYDTQYTLSDPHIFLPVTGQNNGGYVNEDWGCYWSKSVYLDYSYDGLCINIVFGNPEDKYFKCNSWLWRRVAQAIRPVINK